MPDRSEIAIQMILQNQMCMYFCVSYYNSENAEVYEATVSCCVKVKF
jgi:hypothetical protein